MTSRDGGHVSGEEQKHFSPLGTKTHFRVNSSKTILFYLQPTLPPCHVVANQELSPESGVQLASSLGLINARGLCASGHVIRASLPAIRL